MNLLGYGLSCINIVLILEKNKKKKNKKKIPNILYKPETHP